MNKRANLLRCNSTSQIVSCASASIGDTNLCLDFEIWMKTGEKGNCKIALREKPLGTLLYDEDVKLRAMVRLRCRNATLFGLIEIP